MRLGYEVFHDDVHALVDFYVRVLGFTQPRHSDPDADHVVVRRDDVAVGCTRHPEAAAVNRKPPHGSEVVLHVKDLQGEYQRVVESGWPISDPLQRRPWGLTDFRLFDPSGQYIRLTTQ
jgi:predicted enzyme related to lactoylglutathione lyase